MNKHTALLPDGRTITRNSKTHVYTHVVIARTPAVERVRRLRAEADSYLANAARYRANMANAARYRANKSSYAGEDMFARFGTETVLGWARDAEYRALKAQEEAEQIACTGEDELWGVVGWCGRPDLALKQSASYGSKYNVETMILVADVR